MNFNDKSLLQRYWKSIYKCNHKMHQNELELILSIILMLRIWDAISFYSYNKKDLYNRKAKKEGNVFFWCSHSSYLGVFPCSSQLKLSYQTRHRQLYITFRTIWVKKASFSGLYDISLTVSCTIIMQVDGNDLPSNFF